MEKNMNYNFMLPLKDICVRKVVVILWTKYSTLPSFQKCASRSDVKADIKKLEIPPLLTEQMTYVVRFIRHEITSWINFHANYLDISFKKLVGHVSLLCWTNFGTVDYRKSAEKLIHYEMFSITKCYILACLYCLDDYISVLWVKLPRQCKTYFYKEGISSDTEPPLEFCWPYILKGEETKLNMFKSRLGNPTTFNQYAFEYSAYEGNKAATKYFLNKLTKAEREVSLFRASEAVIRRQSEIIVDLEDFPPNCRSDTFRYLLSLMNPEQQMEIFRGYPYKVLGIFHNCPWQDFFMHITELIWPFLTVAEYTRVLQMISDSIKSGFNLTKLFHKLLLHGSNDFRKHFVNLECSHDACLRSFFEVQDSETIKLIFRNVDSEDRKRLVYSKPVMEHFYKSILRGKCGMVKLCLLEAALSKEDKEALKKLFFEFLTKIEDDRNVVQRSILSSQKTAHSIEERRKEFPSESNHFMTETELDTREMNRKEYIWENFLNIVDEGNTKTPCARILHEEDMGYPSSNSDFEEDDDLEDDLSDSEE